MLIPRGLRFDTDCPAHAGPIYSRPRHNVGPYSRIRPLCECPLPAKSRDSRRRYLNYKCFLRGRYRALTIHSSFTLVVWL